MVVLTVALVTFAQGRHHGARLSSGRVVCCFRCPFDPRSEVLHTVLLHALETEPSAETASAGPWPGESASACHNVEGPSTKPRSASDRKCGATNGA
eukprot:704406-Amphidinium_carterae.1